MVDVLPDSRCVVLRDSKPSPYGNTIPVFCANCTQEWGRVAEKDMTFAFVLCDPCAEKHGPVAGTYMEPDHVFFARVAQAKEDAQTRGIDTSTPEGMARALDDPNSSLAKVARDWEAERRRVV